MLTLQTEGRCPHQLELRRAQAMEDKDENSLRAYQQTEDDLEGKGQFFEVGAGGSESKSPAKS